MKVRIILVATVLLIISINISAQKQFVNGCEKPERVILLRGETFKNNCDSAYIMNSASANKMDGMIKKNESIIDGLEKQNGILKTIITRQDDEIKRWEKVDSIWKTSYGEIKKAQDSTSLLVKNSLDNTNRALSYAKKMKYTSYLTSFAVGGIAGGLIDNNKYSFGLGGALIGAAGGILINYLFQEIILGD
jgi:hypothetical protein